jgi:hypothetical protein
MHKWHDLLQAYIIKYNNLYQIFTYIFVQEIIIILIIIIIKYIKYH